MNRVKKILAPPMETLDKGILKRIFVGEMYPSSVRLPSEVITHEAFEFPSLFTP